MKQLGHPTCVVFVSVVILAIWMTGIWNVDAAEPQPEGGKVDNAKRELVQNAVRDRLWLWSHPAGSYNGQYSLEGKSTLSPEAAAEFLGIKNICMVRYAGKPVPKDFGQQMQGIKKMNAVVWSVVGDGSTKQENAQEDLNAVLELKRNHANLSGAILDDFFVEPGNRTKKSRITLEELKSIQNRLHEQGLKLWVVVYDHQLDWDITEHLKYCDVITFWTWKSEDLAKMNDNLQIVKRLAGKKPVLVGCYLYDFGNGKTLTQEQMQFQCRQCEQWIQKGDIDGIVFCGSCVADLDLEAVKWTKQWISNLE